MMKRFGLALMMGCGVAAAQAVVARPFAFSVVKVDWLKLPGEIAMCGSQEARLRPFFGSVWS